MRFGPAATLQERPTKVHALFEEFEPVRRFNRIVMDHILARKAACTRPGRLNPRARGPGQSGFGVIGSGARIRTGNRRVNSALLYR